MALDVLSSPAMSSEIERVFSSTGRTITDLRNRLDDEVVEAIECIKSWEKEGFSMEIEGTKISLSDFDSLIGILLVKVQEEGTEDKDNEWEDE